MVFLYLFGNVLNQMLCEKCIFWINTMFAQEIMKTSSFHKGQKSYKRLKTRPQPVEVTNIPPENEFFTPRRVKKALV